MTTARRFVVWPHHPDTLHVPPTSGANPSPTQAMTWNIFRTAELMPPAFWLRRLNASLGLEPPRPASVVATVRLWPRLPLPLAASIPAREPVHADVVIETEHAVWALLVCEGRDIDVERSERDTGIDRIAMLAYAASWHAGRRRCFVGVIVQAPEDAPRAVALIERYQASPTALQLRVPSRGHDASNVAGFGFTTWHQLIAIVRDASRDDTIHSVERSIARRTLDWFDDIVCLA
jgi:hypothetical protein